MKKNKTKKKDNDPNLRYPEYFLALNPNDEDSTEDFIEEEYTSHKIKKAPPYIHQNETALKKNHRDTIYEPDISYTDVNRPLGNRMVRYIRANPVKLIGGAIVGVLITLSIIYFLPISLPIVSFLLFTI